MLGPNVQAFIPVISTRASAPFLPIAEETSSADIAKNPIQRLFLNVALNQVTSVSLKFEPLKKCNCEYVLIRLLYPHLVYLILKVLA